MDQYHFLIIIAGILFAGVMSPGPTFLIIARITLMHSKAHGFVTALGTALGVAIFAVLASLGVTALLAQIPTAYLAFKIIGGVYLLYLAWRISRSAAQPLPVNTSSRASSASLSKSFMMGLLTQLSNPKTALVIAGIFAAFVPANPPSNTIWLVSALAFVIDFTWYATVVLVLSTPTSRNVYQNAKSMFDRIAAVLLGAVGLKLILSSE